jgi:uncharacterized protein YjeT (DUF2065 family)
VKKMMRRSTGLALVAIGAILALAVHARLTVINLQLTGLILVITGLAGLRAPQRAYRWVRSHPDQLRDALDRFMALPEQPRRVPLDTLLRPEVTARTPAGRRG